MTATEGPSTRASRPWGIATPTGPRHRRDATAPPIGSVVLIVVGGVSQPGRLRCRRRQGARYCGPMAPEQAMPASYTTPTERFETTSYAITSIAIDLGRPGPAVARRPRHRADTGRGHRVRAGLRGGRRQRDVDSYLAGVGHARIDDLEVAPFSVDYRYRDGGPPAGPPTDEDFWAASASGSGPQSVRWSPSTGQWAVVVMNADGSAGVSVEASAGARVPWLLGVGIGLAIAGLLGLALGAAMMVAGVVMLARREYVDLGGPEPVAGQPVRLEARLDDRQPGRPVAGEVAAAHPPLRGAGRPVDQPTRW